MKPVTKELFIKASPERVFNALAEKAGLERWLLKAGFIESKPSGAVQSNWAPGLERTEK